MGNNFGGAPFSGSGQHVFSNIKIVSCGTYNDLFNSPVGAIDILVTNIAGTNVSNVRFSCIEIVDSKNDAIYIYKKSGNGFVNLVFENITVDGTGKEYPNNSAGTGNGGVRGYGLLFWGSPSGNATNCNMTYTDRGGNATTNVGTTNIGSLSWTVPGSCPGGCTSLSASVTITSPANGANITGCPVGPIAITATAVPPSGNTITNIEFFVDGSSIGIDNSSTYSMNYNSPAPGAHTLTAVAHFSGGTTATSSTTNIMVGGDIKQTSTAPTIDGTAEALWNNYAAFPLNQGGTTAPDLDGTFKIMYDATNLYLLVDVTDDFPVNNNGANNWEEDGIEVYIDMGNNKSATYGTNDFQYGFLWNNATVFEYKHAATAVTFVRTDKSSPAGYIMEIRFPWSTLLMTPTAGSYMGFDVKINDDDNGGTREHELSWYDGTYGAWNSPALFGTLQFASCGPLPVSFLNFTGEKKNGEVVLDWTTVSEINNNKFIIERSTDLSEWKPVGEVLSKGNSSSVVGYSFTDNAPEGTEIYYRLQQVDIDGSIAYSNTILVKAEERFLSIVPNPFEDLIAINTDLEGNLDVRIYDILGRIVYQTSGESKENKLVITPELPSGAYLITVQSDTFVEQTKIIKR